MRTEIFGFENLGKAGAKFWRATFYLRGIHKEVGESSLEDTEESFKSTVEAQDEGFQAAMKNSRLVARQNYITAASFGYFLRRCQYRLRLERSFKGENTQVQNVEDYIDALSLEDAVELVRMATRPGSLALQERATGLFGSEKELLKQMRDGPSAVAQLEGAAETRKLFDYEAAAFGAALFEAEKISARLYHLDYSSTGSRGNIGGFSTDS